MPYRNFPQCLEAINYFDKLHKGIVLNIVLCKIMIIKNCMQDVKIMEYQIPQSNGWEYLWAGNTLVWHLLGVFAMANWNQMMLKVYIYTNPFVTLTPILIAGIRNFSQIQIELFDLMQYESENWPLSIFWCVFISLVVGAQAFFLHNGYFFLKFTSRHFFN